MSHQIIAPEHDDLLSRKDSQSWIYAFAPSSAHKNHAEVLCKKWLELPAVGGALQGAN